MAYVTDSIDDELVGLLQGGGAGLLPTDTIYGLSCRALDELAVERLHKLKGRSAGKPFIILISNIKMLDLLSISKKQADLIKDYWPGPLSVIFSASGAPAWLSRGTGALAVRLPDNEELRNLIGLTGPLISTSANLQGQDPVHSAAEAQTIFGSQLDFYVDTGQLDNPPSTIVDTTDGKLRVVRQGAVKIG